MKIQNRNVALLRATIMAEPGSLAQKYEEFCESLKATPPPWVRAEIDGATAYAARARALSRSLCRFLCSFLFLRSLSAAPALARL